MANYKKFSTVGELIDILQELPRDAKILSHTRNIELQGYSNDLHINIEPRKFKIEQRDTYDAFDGTPYSYNAIFPDKNGDIEAIEI